MHVDIELEKSMFFLNKNDSSKLWSIHEQNIFDFVHYATLDIVAVECVGGPDVPHHHLINGIPGLWLVN